MIVALEFAPYHAHAGPNTPPPPGVPDQCPRCGVWIRWLELPTETRAVRLITEYARTPEGPWQSKRIDCPAQLSLV